MRQNAFGKKLIAASLALVLILVVARIYLPYFLRDYFNRNLQTMQEYTGHVDAVHVALWRGAYELHDLVITKRDADTNEPFCAIKNLQLAIQWSALLKGSIVGEATFFRPSLNLIQGETSAQTQLGTDTNWASALENLFPFSFNQVNVHNGTIKFRAPGIKSRDAVVLHDVEASVTNLTNVVDQNNEAFASFQLQGKVLGNAPLLISGRTNPYADSPTFELDLKLEQVQLKQLNPWLQVYANVNADNGSFALYSSSAAANRKFKGYVKPVLKDVEIVSIKDDPNPLKKLWAVLVDGVATVFKNHPHDQLATKIPFSGTIEDPKAGIFTTIVNVLRNAFVAAFSSSMDQKIHLQDVASPSDDKTARENPFPDK